MTDKPSPQTKWNAAHPLELLAHQYVRSALKRGLLHRGPCEVCGGFGKRDELIIRLQASGATVTPIVVAGITPRPVQGRFRDRPRKPSGRFDIMNKISAVTSDDVAKFHPDDIEDAYYEGDED